MTLMFLVSFNLCAQGTISVVGEVNYNTFSHKSLSDFQQQLLEDFGEVDMRVNDDFGANIGFTVGVKVEEINTQFFVAYNSTGGKISYSDYSGVVRATQLLKGYTLGGEYQFKLTKDTTSKGMFYFGARGFVNYSTLDLESYSRVADYVSTESLGFNSIDIGLGIRLFYDIPISVVKLRLNVGYDLVFAGELQFNDDNDFYLQDNSEDPVKTGWSGFRSGIGIVVPF